MYANAVYTTLSVRSYDSRGNLKNNYYKDKISNNEKLESTYIITNRTYTIKATGSVYKGPSSSSGQSESVTITIN